MAAKREPTKDTAKPLLVSW